MKTAYTLPNGNRILRLGAFAFALADRNGNQVSDVYPCPLLAYTGKRIDRQAKSVYDGNGKPGVDYRKPLRYSPSPLKNPVQPNAEKGNLFGTTAKREQVSGIDKYKEYMRSRRGRRALRTILHAMAKEQERQNRA